MTYKPPSTKMLHKSTKELQQGFNHLIKRFIPPNYLTLRTLITGLKEAYIEKVKEKDTWWGKAVPSELRLDQIGCITQLLDNMPETSVDEAVISQAHLILLGALIYRYLRIESSYTGFAGGYGFFGGGDNSALNLVIEELLNFSDANVLDAQTIVTCCSEYRDYLKRKGVSEKYSYIRKDIDFFENLETIIETAKPKAKPVSERMQYIVFIQSFPLMLNRCEEEVSRVLTELAPKLTEALKWRSALNSNEIFDCMKTIKMTQSVSNILDQFIIPEEITLSVDMIEAFKDEMVENMALYSQYALLGAYVLALEKYKTALADDRFSTELNTSLCKALQLAIGSKINNQLDNKAKRLSLTSLSQFVDALTELTINTTAWGGVELFKAELTRQLEIAQNVPEEEVRAEVLVPSCPEAPVPTF